MSESKIVRSAILRAVPGAGDSSGEGEHAYITEQDHVVRCLLSAEANDIALLEREGRPLDVRLGNVDLLLPPENTE